ncbi:MAG TPA: indole-3-glycerol phosphate synthase TrpC [Solirubrobacteraceae bacterium]|nr:indole-3-glycerol phosphate synthase TrpC [Solirubrobacteraceae bacterium]
MSVLERIVASTRAEVARRKREVPLDEPEARAGARSFEAALRAPGLALIAEHKRRSPSAGLLRADLPLSEIVGAYERGGAAALSILTEAEHFGGSLDDLREARGASTLPILRKDFVVDPYQLYETVQAGADAVLLIVAALERDDLSRLFVAADAVGLDVLVEVHDARELDAALELGSRLIGINNRDLGDFSVDVSRTYELLERVPDAITVVSESGFSEPAELAALQRAGVAAVLIGEMLMRADDIEAACRELTQRLDR